MRFLKSIGRLASSRYGSRGLALPAKRPATTLFWRDETIAELVPAGVITPADEREGNPKSLGDRQKASLLADLDLTDSPSSTAVAGFASRLIFGKQQRGPT